MKYKTPEIVRRRSTNGIKPQDVQNSGYGNYGASRTKKSLKGWVDNGGSAYEDIHDNLFTLRERSRDLAMGVPVATGALKTYRTNVIGSGLTPKPTIDYEAAGITEEQADGIERQITREFNLWADSPNCDAERLSTFYELQQLAFYNWLMSGDVFAVLPVKKRAGSPYELCVQLIEADRVCTPNTWQDELTIDTKIVGGVEVDKSGEVVAYHIAKHHPLSYRDLDQGWVRVEAYGKTTGRRNILHVMTRERIGQRRGTPILAPVIEALKQLGRYTDAELVAAVVNGMLTVFIQRDDETEAPPIGEMGAPEEAQTDAGDANTVELGNGTIVDLAPGEKANPVTPGRPNANFDGFVAAILKQIGAALELPYEILVKQFNSSYSASRAALLEAWKAFTMYRDWMVEQFCQPIYEEWLAEAVAKGWVQATGFWTDPVVRKAYCNAQWYGPTQGQLDPTKEVEAADMRVASGYSSRAKEAMEMTGTDFLDNVKTLKRENEMMKEANGNNETATERDSDNERRRENL